MKKFWKKVERWFDADGDLNKSTTRYLIVAAILIYVILRIIL